MIDFERNDYYNACRQKILSGKITSIWRDDTFFKGASSYPVPNFKYYTAEYCDFEKNIVSAEGKMVYHLNGYGTYHNEALSSFLGESSERYTFASFYRLLEERVVLASYNELVNKHGESRVCSIETLNGYFRQDDKDNYLSEDDQIQWVRMNSLINTGQDVYMPMQLVVSDSGIIFKNEKRFVPAAVSTGTAGHETFEKALYNAIIEVLQIDSFNLWWYGGVKGRNIVIDEEKFLKKYFTDEGRIRKFLSSFHISFTDISFEKDIDIVVCEVFGLSDNTPKYTIGVQGGTDMENVMYRGLMECLAVLEYNLHLPWIDPERYKSVKTDSANHIHNLDDNVVLYSKYGKPDKIKHDHDIFGYREKKYEIIDSLKELSNYAGFLDITLPEFYPTNFKVARVIIPELLPICLPSYPAYHHIRYKNIGGIRNDYPHPLA